MKNYGKDKLDPADTDKAIMSPITAALENNNITDERLAGKIDDLIDCKRGVGVDKEGKLVESGDNPSQLKAVDMALKLKQAYPAERSHITGELTLEDKLRQLREKEKGDG